MQHTEAHDSYVLVFVSKFQPLDILKSISVYSCICSPVVLYIPSPTIIDAMFTYNNRIRILVSKVQFQGLNSIALTTSV